MSTKKVSQTAAANKAALAALRGSDLSVEVNGQMIILSRPSRAQFVALTQHLIDDQDALEALKENKDLDRAMAEMEKIVILCVPGIETNEEAYDLIMLTGGSNDNELIRQCEVLCGINREAVEAATEANPTSS